MQALEKKPLVARVAIDLALERLLDYQIPPHLQGHVQVGMQVKVLVKSQEILATIVELLDKSPYTNLKEIQTVVQEKPLFSEDRIKLANLVSLYYCAPLSKVFRLMLPPGVRKNHQEKTQWFIKSLLSQDKLKEYVLTLRQKASAQATILDHLLLTPEGLFLSELLEKTKASPAAIEALVKKKIVEKKKIGLDRSILPNATFFPSKPKTLNAQQHEAFTKIKSTLLENRFSVHLLLGVTGSGKTEVYLQAIDQALTLGGSILFLVPEIALTAQTLERVTSRFPSHQIVMFHHRLGDGERRDAWHRVEKGEVKIVIGARSSIFSPMQNLKLIILDEEHDHSYKQQEDHPCYHARDVAIMRANAIGATVVLGSATPSLESYYHAKNGKYTLSHLHSRAGDSSLAKVTIIDMGQDKHKGIFSDTLLHAIEKRIRTGEQSLLLLNRRGYHSYQICLACHESVKCNHCAISLTHHRKDQKLSCHLCGFQIPPPKTCPHCHCEQHLNFKGCGTEQIERSLKAIFPEAKLLRMDADTTRHKGSHEILIKEFRSGKADILIGTQMIAKGLHFPLVSLVGILQADTGLQIPDFRATESTFQLITQASGRAGRAEIPGEVFVQTYLPSHLAIQTGCAQDFSHFAEEELATRESFSLPPFTKLIKLTMSGPLEDKTQELLQRLRTHLIQKLPPSCQVLSIVPSGYPKIKDRYYFQFLIKTISPLRLQALLSQEKLPANYRLLVDIDPLSTFF